MFIKMQNNDSNNIQFGNPHSKRGQTENQLQFNKKQTKGTIYAGDLKLQQDDITMKKVEAHKKAMKAVLETHAKEKKIDDGLESIREHMNELKTESIKANEEIKSIQDKKAQLKDTYGITDDLEMQDPDNIGAMKDYQDAVSEYDNMASIWEKRIENANKVIESEMRTISGIEIERLKTHPMVDAQDEANDILEAASKEVIGMLIKETKDHIDEEIKEKDEEADKKAEEKQKLEEKQKQENASNDKGTTETSNVDNNQLNQIAKADMAQEKLQKEVKNMLDNQKLLEEDLKGIIVDEQM